VPSKATGLAGIQSGGWSFTSLPSGQIHSELSRQSRPRAGGFGGSITKSAFPRAIRLDVQNNLVRHLHLPKQVNATRTAILSPPRVSKILRESEIAVSAQLGTTQKQRYVEAALTRVIAMAAKCDRLLHRFLRFAPSQRPTNGSTSNQLMVIWLRNLPRATRDANLRTINGSPHAVAPSCSHRISAFPQRCYHAKQSMNVP